MPLCCAAPRICYVSLLWSPPGGDLTSLPWCTSRWQPAQSMMRFASQSAPAPASKSAQIISRQQPRDLSAPSSRAAPPVPARSPGSGSGRA